MTSPTQLPRCTVSPDELHLSFDREAAGPAEAGPVMAMHVTACDPCGSALGVLETQRDAVKYLSRAVARGSKTTAVEQVLSMGARVGRERLADLLYELAKACVLVVPEFELRVERLSEPRSQRAISSDLQSIEMRGRVLDPRFQVESQPFKELATHSALDSGRRCLSVLENVEGKSVRQQLMLVQVHVFEGQVDVAEALLRMLLASHSSAHRGLVFRNLTWILNRQERFDEAVVVGESAIAQYPADLVLLLNYASSVSHHRNRLRFDEIAGRIAGLVRNGASDQAVNLVRHECRHFAEELGADGDEIAVALGLNASEGAL